MLIYWGIMKAPFSDVKLLSYICLKVTLFFELSLLIRHQVSETFLSQKADVRDSLWLLCGSTTHSAGISTAANNYSSKGML